MGRDEPPATPASLKRELARLTDERHELFGRLVELESERTQQTMELLTMAAHELRTPLQSLMMATDMMLTRVRGSADELSRQWLMEHLEMQERTLSRMEELMQSWLLAPQLRAGTLPMAEERIDLAELVQKIVARHACELEWAGCSIELSLQPVPGIWDRLRIDTVLTNVISNAIKYGAGKPVIVSLAAHDDAATIVVRDHGIGVPLDEQARIFERFERGSAPSRVPGFGVGLWMARALLRSVGGTITVENAPDLGASFTIRLPRAPHE
jgi:signal transduction histidine kinase